MTEEVGTSTVFSWTLIVIVVLTTILVVNVGLYGDTKDNVEEFFDLTEIKKIAEDVSSTEDDVNLREANRLADYLFESLTNPKFNDCIFGLEFNGFEEDFIVEFREVNGRSVFRILDSNEDFLTRRNLNKFVYFDGELKSFKFENIKDINLYGYFTEKDKYIFDFNGNLEIEELVPSCGSTFYELSVKNFEGDENIREYLETKIIYLGKEYNLYELINHPIVLRKKNINMPSKLGHTPVLYINERIDVVKVFLKKHLENYFSSASKPFESSSGCWRMDIQGWNGREITTLYSYGFSSGNNFLYKSGKMTLSDDNIYDLYLYVALDNCFLSEEILQKLEEVNPAQEIASTFS